jgi:hypothetical protein
VDAKVKRRGVELPRKCENCANYAQREIGRREMKKLRRAQRGSGRRVFEFAARPYQHSAAVVADAPAVTREPLQPGAHRKIEQNQPETVESALAHLARGLVIGAAGMCIGGVGVLLFPKLPDVRSVAVSTLLATGAGILVSVFEPQDIIIAKLEDWLDRDVDGDGRVGTVGYIVDGKLDDQQGHSLYLRFALEGENAHLRWHQFCRAVTYEDRNFSENESRRHGIVPADWKRICQAFTAQQWLLPAGPRETPELIGDGPKWVKLYADNPPHPTGRGMAGRLYGGR